MFALQIVGMIAVLIYAVGILASHQWMLWQSWKYEANYEDFIWDCPAYLVMGYFWPVMAYYSLKEWMDG